VRTKKIRQIIKAFEQSSLEHLEVTKGKMKISMQKPLGTANLLNSQKSTIEQFPSSESQWIHSPLVGTFYIKMTHESEPLITLGKHVKKNEVVCIIETMKVFNEIRSPIDGVITKIEIEDGSMVEYHQPIILISCDD
jgi:acetyl-CoA carboxylase biotin carboxyl carrier protein